MNKEEISDLFEEKVSQLDDFVDEIEKIKNLIDLIIENVDLLKDDVSDEDIGEISSDINVKIANANVIIKDIFSDAKKLESFIHEIKLLKRKRLEKLAKSRNTATQGTIGSRISGSDGFEQIMKRIIEKQQQVKKEQVKQEQQVIIPYKVEKMPNIKKTGPWFK